MACSLPVNVTVSARLEAYLRLSHRLSDNRHRSQTRPRLRTNRPSCVPSVGNRCVATSSNHTGLKRLKLEGARLKTQGHGLRLMTDTASLVSFAFRPALGGTVLNCSYFWLGLASGLVTVITFFPTLALSGYNAQSQLEPSPLIERGDLALGSICVSRR